MATKRKDEAQPQFESFARFTTAKSVKQDFGVNTLFTIALASNHLENSELRLMLLIAELET